MSFIKNLFSISRIKQFFSKKDNKCKCCALLASRVSKLEEANFLMLQRLLQLGKNIQQSHELIAMDNKYHLNNDKKKNSLH